MSLIKHCKTISQFGHVRLRLPTASGQTWDGVLQKAPKFFSATIPTRNRELYGQHIHERFERIRAQLLMDVPVRKGWLLLLREILELP